MQTANQLAEAESKDASKIAELAENRLRGKRVGMVVFSSYPADPRPRRALDALLHEGMIVDFICLKEDGQPRRENNDKLRIYRIPIRHDRGGLISYAYQYVAFILISTIIFALQAVKKRYDLIYVHNMPDILVLSSLIPRALGARVILDQHDPMPELMMTIFDVDEDRRIVRLLRWLEKLSIACVHQVITVNLACKRIFGSRSCLPKKIGVVMNAPDGDIFPFRPANLSRPSSRNLDKPFIIMYHGSLVERNGLSLAVDALEKLQGDVPNAELRIYGRKTAYLDSVMKDVQYRGLSDSILYLGPRTLEDLVHEIEACDVGVIPNQSNPFTNINTPTRIFEYLALGIPVIAPRTLGVQDYFSEDSLFFFEAGDSEGLAKQLYALYINPDCAAQTVERGQQIYLAHTWKEERQTLVNLVSNLFKGHEEQS